MWKLSAFFLVFFVVASVSFKALYYISENSVFFGSGFWLFLLTEVLAFGTLFVCCLSYEPHISAEAISDTFELPFIGCFILLGSSVSATTFHHNLGLGCSYKWLLYTIILGSLFVLLQLVEFRLSENLWSDGFYYSCCFSVVGLHFTHVALGLIALSYIYYLSIRSDIGLLERYASLVVWYWHFVDYIWLLVYFVVYYCN